MVRFIDAHDFQQITILFTRRNGSHQNRILLWSPAFERCGVTSGDATTSQLQSNWWQIAAGNRVSSFMIACLMAEDAKPIETPTKRMADFALPTVRVPKSVSTMPVTPIQSIFLCISNSLKDLEPHPSSSQSRAAQLACGDDRDFMLGAATPMLHIRYTNEEAIARNAFTMALVFGLLLTFAGAAWWDVITWLVSLVLDFAGPT